MIYELTFLETAKKEWKKLAPNIQKQFKTKLQERLTNPHIPKNRLSTMPNCYKIKLRTVGYRLVYKVIDTRLVVQVVAIGRRDQNTVYKLAHNRLYAHKNHGACPVDVVLPISFCYGDVCRLENKVTVLTNVSIIWC